MWCLFLYISWGLFYGLFLFFGWGLKRGPFYGLLLYFWLVQKRELFYGFFFFFGWGLEQPRGWLNCTDHLHKPAIAYSQWPNTQVIKQNLLQLSFLILHCIISIIFNFAYQTTMTIQSLLSHVTRSIFYSE